jgi:hypothetical protein
VRALTKADKERGVKLRDLGCIVCRNDLELYTPAAIHHLDGQTKEGCHDLTIPLCGRHHQIPDNNKPPRWFARHGQHVHFEEAYGTEWELLEQVNGLI